ncbi:MAG: exodeoxyribonuclease VII small subunit [Clostridia bacterium]|nr:exodeoxyribonuclease VII small subunit [Clostridia bacterium]
MATANKDKAQEAMSFEASLARLDEIVAALERDSVPLSELMKLYEEGVTLLRSCNEQLDTAEQRVKLLKMTPDGTAMTLQDFDEATEGEGTPAKSRRTAKKSSEDKGV